MIPLSVRVAGVEYTVSKNDKLLEDTSNIGQISHYRSTIQLDSGLSKEKAEQVFVHELLHAIFVESGYDEHDEDMVNRLGITLHQVLKDNKLYFG